ncbi:hypothetical protein DTL42_14120 [Bremerella cremea]|uniref:Uncharacterized protein n=1 Tax=Bremerella cremea TaxID=1031537 RepID=A0A368KPR0_9BACT|nr:hypothetical protein [Bremerella cremea]RCS47653.1 hypothetical protein DTL42_14120 [Bremerella cremea]
MEFMVSTLAQGGFANTDPSLYSLLLNEYVYIGITGTSNNTGRNAPFVRLGTHLRKSGSTKSVIWDDILPNKVVSPDLLSVRIVNAFVPSPLTASRIEKAIVWSLQASLEDHILRNRRESGPPTALTSDEQQYADTFISRVLSERTEWIGSKFGTEQEPTVQRHDGDE